MLIVVDAYNIVVVLLLMSELLLIVLATAGVS